MTLDGSEQQPVGTLESLYEGEGGREVSTTRTRSNLRRLSSQSSQVELLHLTSETNLKIRLNNAEDLYRICSEGSQEKLGSIVNFHDPFVIADFLKSDSKALEKLRKAMVNNNLLTSGDDALQSQLFAEQIQLKLVQIDLFVNRTCRITKDNEKDFFVFLKQQRIFAREDHQRKKSLRAFLKEAVEAVPRKIKKQLSDILVRETDPVLNNQQHHNQQQSHYEIFFHQRTKSVPAALLKYHLDDQNLTLNQFYARTLMAIYEIIVRKRETNPDQIKQLTDSYNNLINQLANHAENQEEKIADNPSDQIDKIKYRSVLLHLVTEMINEWKEKIVEKMNNSKMRCCFWGGELKTLQKELRVVLSQPVGDVKEEQIKQLSELQCSKSHAALFNDITQAAKTVLSIEMPRAQPMNGRK